ncbi:MAG: cytochrome c biogenesis protein [Bacteroidota bacterium]
MRNWWKYLTVLLLTYTIVFSLYTPLKPGLFSVSKNELTTESSNEIVVNGYNTDFTKFTSGEKYKVYVQTDGYPVYASSIEILSPKQIKFNIDLPQLIAIKSAHLIVEYAGGHLLLPNAFSIKTSEPVNQNELPLVKDNELKDLKNPDVSGFPNRPMLYESIRNLMLHVPMWFAMMLVMLISVIYSIKYLSTFNLQHDIIAKQAINVGILLGILGLATGSLWARFTWGNWWVNDAKLNGAAITTLVYLAYSVLRGSLQEEQQRAKISAVYNIFAFVIMIVMVLVLPKMADSLHPASGGNQPFSDLDIDNSLRVVFYPAVLGWMGLSLWFLQLKVRIEKIENALS